MGKFLDARSRERLVLVEIQEERGLLCQDGVLDPRRAAKRGPAPIPRNFSPTMSQWASEENRSLKKCCSVLPIDGDTTIFINEGKARTLGPTQGKGVSALKPKSRSGAMIWQARE